MRGKERFSAPGKSSTLIMRFSAGVERIPGLKPTLELDAFRWTKVQLPLLKQGACTKTLLHQILPQRRVPQVRVRLLDANLG